MIRKKPLWRAIVAAALMAGSGSIVAEVIGEVSTVFKLLCPGHKIVVEAFDDPEIDGITCYLSRADAGGFKSIVGLDEDSLL